MSLDGDRLNIGNRNPDLPAAVITQAAGSTQPALAVGGGLVVNGPVNGVTGSAVAPLVGQVPVATSTTTSSYYSPLGAGPWVFDVRAYGAVGDGQMVTDGAISSSGTTVTCGTSQKFKAADKGKLLMFLRAGASGVTTLATTISKVLSASQVVVANAAGATVASGGVVMWATDDTAAVQAAWNAGHTFATAFAAPAGYQVAFPPGAGNHYGIGGPLVTGGATLGNGQLTVPILADTANGISCQLVGVDSGAKPNHWNQTVPSMSASTLVSYGVFASGATQTTSANAAGTPAMISGPTGVNGYGTSAQLYSNVTLHIKNLTLLTTHSANGLGYGAVNAHGMARLIMEDVGYGTTGTVPSGDYNSPAGFANSTISIGVVMPANGNNAVNTWNRVVCHGGYTYGVYATEHASIKDSMILYCWSGLCPVGTFGDGGSGLGASHAVNVSQLTIEGCTWLVNMINRGSGGVGPVLRGVLDTEGTPQFNETSLGLTTAIGQINISGTGGTISTANGTSLQIINDLVPPGPAAALVPSAVATPTQNTYWRWANVTLAGGTVTGIKIGALMGGGSAPTMTSIFTQSSGTLAPITIRVPPGGWYEIDGTVLPTTNLWSLD